jgi:hypothetical protein
VSEYIRKIIVLWILPHFAGMKAAAVAGSGFEVIDIDAVRVGTVVH